MPGPVDAVLRLAMRSWRSGVVRGLAGAPRPVDDPRTHAPGVNSDRVLVFGGGAAMGWGVLSHDMALPGSLARALSRLTGRGTDVDVSADADLMLAQAIPALRPIDLSRYDAIVLTFGLNESVGLESLARWQTDLTALLDYLAATATQGTPIFIVGIHSLTQITRYDALMASIISHHRIAMNRASVRVSSYRENVTFLSYHPAPRAAQTRDRSGSEYREGAAHFARQIAPVLDADANSPAGRRRPRLMPVSARARAGALQGLGLERSDVRQRLDHITESARMALRTSAANITLVEGDKFTTISSRGAFPADGPRDELFSYTAVGDDDSFVVPDVSRDPRFAALPASTSGSPMLFYAGHHIDAPNGTPIAVLSVHDFDARDIGNFNVAHLRDFALRAQTAIWLGSRAAKR